MAIESWKSPALTGIDPQASKILQSLAQYTQRQNSMWLPSRKFGHSVASYTQTTWRTWGDATAAMDIMTAPFPLRMTVTAHCFGGFNASVNTSWHRIYLPQPGSIHITQTQTYRGSNDIEDAVRVTHTQTASNSWQSWSVMGWYDFDKGEQVGYRLGCMLNGGNIYLRAGTDVRFEPL